MKCKDCFIWYGAEDDEYGPCMVKHAHGNERYVTFGYHECDELYVSCNEKLSIESCNGHGENETCACATNEHK